MWTREQVRSQKLTLTVVEVTRLRIHLSLEGTARLATAADPASAARGFDVHLWGHVEYDAVKHVIDRLDIVAVGDHWGESRYTGKARSGRHPLGIAFELVGGDAAAHTLPPQAARAEEDYLRTGQ